MVGGHPAKRRSDDLAGVNGIAEVTATRHLLGAAGLQGDGRAAIGVEVRPASVHADPAQPWGELFRVAELRELAPCGRERVLGDVVGVADAHDPGRQPVQLRGMLLHKHLECLEVAGLGTTDGVQGSVSFVH